MYSTSAVGFQVVCINWISPFFQGTRSAWPGSDCRSNLNLSTLVTRYINIRRSVKRDLVTQLPNWPIWGQGSWPNQNQWHRELTFVCDGRNRPFYLAKGLTPAKRHYPVILIRSTRTRYNTMIDFWCWLAARGISFVVPISSTYAQPSSSSSSNSDSSKTEIKTNYFSIYGWSIEKGEELDRYPIS